MDMRFLDKFLTKLRVLPRQVCRDLWQIGRDDPRMVIHSLKVGLALTVVSLLYLLDPLFAGIGQNAIWAVMTVVVVLEFAVGATLCKGVNSGIGTVFAGSLAFFIKFVADESGWVFQAVFIGLSVFLIGAATTYMRSLPYIKKNYDYGVVIFLLTFNIITVSSYRVDNVLRLAHERFYTIAIGVGICLLMGLFIFPIWSSQDLHNSTVNKLECLSRSIEACIGEYFQDSEIAAEERPSDNPVKSYKTVLDSKSTDETLALHASWEPRHTRHFHRCPCQQYVKCGSVLRHFGYTAAALHGCLESEIQAPRSVRALFKDPCIRVAREVSKVLVELADSIRNRRCCSPGLLSDNLRDALQDLNNIIKSQPRLFLGSTGSQAINMLVLADAAANQEREKNASVESDSCADQSQESKRKALRPSFGKLAITSLEFSEALPFAAFVSLLLEMVARLDLVIEEVEELGRVAYFQDFNPVIEIVVPPENGRTEQRREIQPNLGSQTTE